MKASALGFRQIVVRYEMFRYEFECIIGPKKNVGKYAATQHDNPAHSADYEVTDQLAKFYCRTGFVPIIWLPRFPRTPHDYELLAHEVGHAVIFMLEERGVPIDHKNDETFCYALGHGVRTILEAKRGR